MAVGGGRFLGGRARETDAEEMPGRDRMYETVLSCTLPYLRPGDQVLDLGCGTGTLTVALAARAARVRAIDASEEMVRQTAARAARAGAENVQAVRTDLFDPDLEPGSCDVVTAFDILCYVEDQVAALARIRSLLKPGGLFLSVTDCLGERPTKDGLQKLWRSRTGAMPYVAFYRAVGLEETIARAGFLILERERLFRVPPSLFVAARKGGN